MSLSQVIDSYQKASKRLFLLDYDGTLVPFTTHHKDAKPGQAALGVLQSLGNDDKNTIVIISGRDQKTLDAWLGDLPLTLAAEHGAFRKIVGKWTDLAKADNDWKKPVLPFIKAAADVLPGAVVEQKQTALVFHYRPAKDQKMAAQVAGQLARYLKQPAARYSLEIRYDKREKVVEVKQGDTNKAALAKSYVTDSSYDFILIGGDASSDETMFAVAPPDAFCLKIGSGTTAAKHRLEDSSQMIKFLQSLAKS